MCALCSALNVPVCATGMCGGNFHQILSAAIFAGTSGLGIAVGWIHQFKEKHDKKK